ncbi:VOC family protein [Chloroflexota bacterium]
MDKQEIASISDLKQVGIIVKDIEKAAEYYAAVLGTGQFQVVERDVRGILRSYSTEEASLGRVKIGRAQVGQVEFELIEPVEATPAFKEFLLARLEGVHHLAYHVDDIARVLKTLESRGFEAVLRVTTDKHIAVFVGGPGTDGALIELVQNM